MSEDAVFWFDPTCSFTWLTSRWLLCVTTPRNLTVGWRLMSLALLNGVADPPGEEIRAVRLLFAAGERYGPAARAALYTEVGRRRHEEQRAFDAVLVGESLAAAGLPGHLAGAADDDGLDAGVRESHDEGQRRVGTESGSPILALGDGPGFFGPVVSPVPTGEAAEKLFDAVRLLSAVPEFAELKRARTAG